MTSVEVTNRRSADSPHLPALLKATTKRFKVKTVAADKGYISHSNLDAIASVGAFPLIPFKTHHNPGGGYWSKTGNRRVTQGSRELWRRMYEFFTYNREEFLAHYHQRSNVETTFHMIKSKFGTRVRAKTPTAQVNEVLAKVLCHNLCCLVSATFELGIDAKFWHKESVA
ncbi:MAG: transposase [Candidatus Cybelea sp.]